MVLSSMSPCSINGIVDLTPYERHKTPKDAVVVHTLVMQVAKGLA